MDVKKNLQVNNHDTADTKIQKGLKGRADREVYRDFVIL